MKKMRPHIGVSYVAKLPVDEIELFLADVDSSELCIVSDKQDDFEIQAGVELLLSTAIAVYLLKPYFVGFLNEAGKDHYQVLRRALIT
ncbi:MAG: hypothetical protein CMP08_01290 [Xanthomonadales bacterium]|nr:hypothetical protein [Xanthomonadales bacterium]|tara:strand:+ start:28 stop:291 length:264 start_codon:yes stop_codon:yes gene_type:complete